LQLRRLLQVIPVTERDQVIRVIALRFREPGKLVCDRHPMMHLQIKAAIARGFCLLTVPPAYLTGVIVSFEDLLAKLLWIKALERVTAVIRIIRDQSVLARTQRRIVYI